MGGKICCKRSGSKPKLKGVDPPIDEEIEKDVDQLTGLSKEDIRLLRNTWAYISERNLIITVGAELFINLLVEHPYLMVFFESFNLVKTAPRLNENIGRHAVIFMGFMKDLLDNLEEHEKLKEMMEEMAQPHLALNVTPEDTRSLTDMLIKVLKTYMGEKFTWKENRAWDRFFDFINKSYKESYSQGDALKLRHQHC